MKIDFFFNLNDSAFYFSEEEKGIVSGQIVTRHFLEYNIGNPKKAYSVHGEKTVKSENEISKTALDASLCFYAKFNQDNFELGELTEDVKEASKILAAIELIDAYLWNEIEEPKFLGIINPSTFLVLSKILPKKYKTRLETSGSFQQVLIAYIIEEDEVVFSLTLSHNGNEHFKKLEDFLETFPEGEIKEYYFDRFSDSLKRNVEAGKSVKDQLDEETKSECIQTEVKRVPVTKDREFVLEDHKETKTKLLASFLESYSVLSESKKRQFAFNLVDADVLFRLSKKLKDVSFKVQYYYAYDDSDNYNIKAELEYKGFYFDVPVKLLGTENFFNLNRFLKCIHNEEAKAFWTDLLEKRYDRKKYAKLYEEETEKKEDEKPDTTGTL